MFWPQQQNAQKVSNRCVKARYSLIVLKVLSNPNQSINQSILNRCVALHLPWTKQRPPTMS